MEMLRYLILFMAAPEYFLITFQRQQRHLLATIHQILWVFHRAKMIYGTTVLMYTLNFRYERAKLTHFLSY